MSAKHKISECSGVKLISISTALKKCGQLSWFWLTKISRLANLTVVNCVVKYQTSSKVLIEVGLCRQGATTLGKIE